MSEYRLAPCWCPRCKRRYEGIIHLGFLPRRHRTGLPAFIVVCTDCEVGRNPQHVAENIRNLHEHYVRLAQKHPKYSFEVSLRERLRLRPLFKKGV